MMVLATPPADASLSLQIAEPLTASRTPWHAVQRFA
jgi:hypothetical protein